MEFIVGVVLALVVCIFATVVGLDRDRGFYPTVGIVVATYYGLFAVIGGSVPSLLRELVGVSAFLLLALLGLRVTLWWVVGALAAHGVFDWFHARLIADPGVPLWWPGFCMTFDVVAAAYLSWRLGYSRLRAKPDQDSMSAERFGRRIRPYVHAELMAAKTRRRGGDSTASFKRLERAHVLGQVSTRQHALVHWRMLRWAVRQRQVSEIGAQAFRIVGAAVLTGVGLVPEGNTGGGNVSAFRRQPVARDLATIIAAARSG